MSKEVVIHQPAMTPMDLIAKASNAETSIEQMERLFDLQLRWEENEARKAFNQAFADFKAEGIKITKNKRVHFSTAKGTTDYKHAVLGDICGQVIPLMSKYGLSHAWEVKQEGGSISVTCKISHSAGHSQTTTIQGEPDESGGKNKIQAVGSAVSYLQRYSLLCALGLATNDQDNDGAGVPAVELITEAQKADLEALAKEVGADIAKFCTFYRINELSELPTAKFKGAVANLEAKRGAK